MNKVRFLIQSDKGYTLTEIVVLLAITGILTSIFLPKAIKSVENAHVAQVKSVKEKLNSAILYNISDQYLVTGKWITPTETDVTMAKISIGIRNEDWSDNGKGVWTYAPTGATITYSHESQNKFILEINYQ